LIEEWSSSEGADGGDARTESGAEEGLRWCKTGEVNAWVMGSVCGTRVWTDEANGTRGKKKVGRRPVAPFNGSGGEGAGGLGTAWRQSGR
jgi:hypothetical protein